MIRKWAIALSAFAGLAIIGTPARATLLTSGMTTPALPVTVTGTVLATAAKTVTDTNASGAITATVDIRSAVVKDAVTGKIDFLYQVHYTAGTSSGFERISVTDYTDWATDVGYITPPSATMAGSPLNFFVTPAMATSTAPVTVTRSFGPSGLPSLGTLQGNTIGFNFSAMPIFKGNYSAILVVKTNAPGYDSNMGGIQLIDGVTIEASDFTPVPEPATMALVLAGLPVLGIIRLRRRAKQS